MSYFDNCSLTVIRSKGKRTAAGFEQTSTSEVLTVRGDAQESGHSLTRLQQLHESGDILFFADASITEVESNDAFALSPSGPALRFGSSESDKIRPGDSVELEMDDGRTLEGTIEEVMGLDNSILITVG